MLRYTVASITLAFVGVAPSLGQLNKPCASDAEPCVVTTRVTERPAGKEDDHNQDFMLSRKPVATSPLQISLNGLELSLGSDYASADGSTKIHLVVPPKNGDLLRVNYETETEGESRSRSAPIAPTKVAAFVRQALLEQVSKERTIPPTSQPALATRQTETQPVTASVPRSNQLNRSLAMLERRLSEQQTSPNASKRRTSQAETGVEGTGDQPLTSPYAVLLQITPVNASPFTSSQIANRDLKRSTPRSIQMLQRALDSGEQQKSKTIKKEKR